MSNATTGTCVIAFFSRRPVNVDLNLSKIVLCTCFV